jgi:hypothetical protein
LATQGARQHGQEAIEEMGQQGRRFFAFSMAEATGHPNQEGRRRVSGRQHRGQEPEHFAVRNRHARQGKAHETLRPTRRRRPAFIQKQRQVARAKAPRPWPKDHFALGLILHEEEEAARRPERPISRRHRNLPAASTGGCAQPC